MAKVKAAEGNREWEKISFDEDFHTGIAYESNIGGLEAMIGFFFVDRH